MLLSQGRSEKAQALISFDNFFPSIEPVDLF